MNSRTSDRLRLPALVALAVTVGLGANTASAAAPPRMQGVDLDDDRLSPEAALAIVQRFEETVERHSSYAALADDRWRRALDDVRRAIDGPVPRAVLAAGLERSLARIGDGHASLEGPPGGSRRTLPFVAVPLDGSATAPIVAVRLDREDLVDPQRPFLEAIDGVAIDRWLEAASKSVADGPPQRVRGRACSRLRRFDELAAAVAASDGLPQPAERRSISVTLRGNDGVSTVDMPLLDSPRAQRSRAGRGTGRLSDGTAYLRLERMDEKAADDADGFLSGLDPSEPLIIDVRGNQGGTREALRVVAAALLPREAAPVVYNAARPLLVEGVVPPERQRALVDRGLRPPDDPAWTEDERAAARRFVERFRSARAIPEDRFGPVHVAILSPRADGPRTTRRVAVLSDPRSFSAADIFLAAMKELPGVTVVGQPSGGGSGAARRHDLGQGFTLRLSSMISFAPDGTLFDETGVVPDVPVTPDPRDLTLAGADLALAAALKAVKE